MTILITLLFCCLFAIILIVLALGYKVVESLRRKQVGKVLETVSAKPAEVYVDLLLNPKAQIDSLQRLLGSLHVVDNLQAKLDQSGLGWGTNGFLLFTAISGFAGFLFGLGLHRRGMIWLIVAGIAAGFFSLPYLYVGIRRKKRLGQFEEQFPDALDFLSRAMRAGHAFSVSFELICEEVADPLGKEFRTFFNEQNLGASLETAMENLVKRVPLLDVRFFASAVILQRQTGGNLGEILTRLSAVIRGRFQLKGKVKAASAHGKMTSVILTLLPIGTMLGLMMVAPTYLQGMANDADGVRLIAAAMVAMVLGFFIMRKITNIEV
jgi:tight adherence protein B